MTVTDTHTHKAWRLHAHNDLRFDDVETPAPAPDGVVVRIEAGMVLSQFRQAVGAAASMQGLNLTAVVP